MKYFSTGFSIIASILLLFPMSGYGQKADYDKEFTRILDSLNKQTTIYFQWHNSEVYIKYGKPRIKAMNELKSHPEKEKELRPYIDSLTVLLDAAGQESKKRYALITEKKSEAYDKYKLVSGEAFKSVFYRRHSLTTEELWSMLNSATKEVRHSPAGKATKAFLTTKKVLPGDKFKPFPCFDVNGKKFNWNIISGKKTIIIGDGLGCMTHGMDNSAPARYFKELKEKYGADNFVLIIYWYNTDLQEMKKGIAEFGVEEFINVADDLEFSTPLEILYDTQGTPSLLYINADGTLSKQVMGIDDYIDSFLKN
ncbi:MAG: hypothetical protein M0R37_11435 [Bacteroidales bacterium]|nr:hypothetical protein [Bacteroidales bacterium]